MRCDVQSVYTVGGIATDAHLDTHAHAGTRTETARTYSTF